MSALAQTSVSNGIAVITLGPGLSDPPALDGAMRAALAAELDKV